MSKRKSAVEYEVPTSIGLSLSVLHTIKGTTSKEWETVKKAMVWRLENRDNKLAGICSILRTIEGGAVHEQVSRLFNTYSYHYHSILKNQMYHFLKEKGWYSGCAAYPIADPKITAKSAYHNQSKWDRRTTYGKRRHITMQYMLAYIGAIIYHLKEQESRHG